MIKVIDQYLLSESGKRSNNEDKYGFVQGLVYILCDGVGGADRGEVASDLVVKTFVESFSKNPNSDVESVLNDTQQRMSDYLNDHPEAEGMATTLTFSQIHENGIQIAWIGDSRVYQIRDGQIVFKTTDHSWVNEALKAGIISEEEAVNHPRSNVITRAVQGIHKKVLADIVWISDVKKDDIFFHCSDGILEAWDDEDLCALFSSGYTSVEIIEKIKEECMVSSKDNFTALFYKIDGVDLRKQDISKFKKDHFTENKSVVKQSIWKVFSFVCVAIIVVLVCILLFGNPLSKIFDPTNSKPVEQNDKGKKKASKKNEFSSDTNSQNEGRIDTGAKIKPASNSTLKAASPSS